MKLGIVIVCLCMISGTFATSLAKQKRIRPNLKPNPPKVPSEEIPKAPASLDLPKVVGNKKQRPVKQQSKVTKDDLPSYFKRTKPSSLEGWLSKPKKKTSPPAVASDPAVKNLVKDGYCGYYLNFGIQCGVRLNQCKTDQDCPGVTKCCLVSDCGFMCVKPKDEEYRAEKKKRNTKTSDGKHLESATNSEGLKLEDIMKTP